MPLCIAFAFADAVHSFFVLKAKVLMILQCFCTPCLSHNASRFNEAVMNTTSILAMAMSTFKHTIILVSEAHDTMAHMYRQLYLWIYFKYVHVQCNSSPNCLFEILLFKFWSWFLWIHLYLRHVNKLHPLEIAGSEPLYLFQWHKIPLWPSPPFHCTGSCHCCLVIVVFQLGKSDNPMFCANFAGATRQVETAGAARHSCVA